MTDRKPPAPFRTALEDGLAQLLMTLQEAQDYLDKGQDLAAIGTLTDMEDLFADLSAAMRLFVRSQRKQPPSGG